MAKTQTSDFTARGADLQERLDTQKTLGVKPEHEKIDFKKNAGQRLVQSQLRDENLRMKAQLRKVGPKDLLPKWLKHIRILPAFAEYHEEMPSSDGTEQIRMRRTKQEARGARFTLRRQAIGDNGSVIGEKVGIRVPLDGNGCSWAGEHISQGFAEEDLIRAVLTDPNWCPPNGNSMYYIATVTDEELEHEENLRADVDFEIAEERRRQRTEAARSGIGAVVEEERGL